MDQHNENRPIDGSVELLKTNGFDGLAEAVTVLLNTAMVVERSEHLGAAPYERSAQRMGYANGYKDKFLKSRLGTLSLKVPQTRDSGCDVTIRYLAQVIRIFPPEQVFAQTLLPFKLVASDPRYVGITFAAPEDNPITLRDHTWQMEVIGELSRQFPAASDRVTLHAGELVPGLVPPEHLGSHIREAIEMAHARRIGHGVDTFSRSGRRRIDATGGMAENIDRDQSYE